ncbi:hypothetical protein OROGR_024984 [Orobanche gracilis]
MSRSNPSSLKRKGPETKTPGLVDAERIILNSIRSKKDLGIWIRDLKQESKLPHSLCDKAVKSLVSKKLIKEVQNVQNKAKKHYMASEFEPCKEISGGDWFANGEFNTSLIDDLKKACFRYISEQRVATLEGVHNTVIKSRAVTSRQHVGEILKLMVLDNDIVEEKSNGLGDYYSIPRDTTCYKVAGGAGVSRGPRVGAFASIPCGACPRIRLCTSDGIISPSTCVYYTKWLNIEF